MATFLDLLSRNITPSNAIATTDVAVATDIITVNMYIATGTAMRFRTTTTLPDPLAVDTTYYAINSTNNSIQIATTLANAIASTEITITDVGEGTHYYYFV